MKKIFCMAVLIFFITILPAYADYFLYCKDGSWRFVLNYKITENDVTYITKYGIYHLPLDKVNIEKTEYERDMKDHGPKWQELQKKAEEKRLNSLKEESLNPPPRPQLIRPETLSKPQIISPPPTKSDKELELEKKLKEIKDNYMVELAKSGNSIGLVSVFYYDTTMEMLWDRKQWNNIRYDVKEKLLSNLFNTWSGFFNKKEGTLIIKDYSTGDVLATINLYSVRIDGNYLMK